MPGLEQGKSGAAIGMQRMLSDSAAKLDDVTLQTHNLAQRFACD